MTEEHFTALVSFQKAINDELGRGTLTITRPRLFVLSYLCAHPRKGVTSQMIAAAARTLPVSLTAAGVYRLRHRLRAYHVLRQLRRSGLITRVETRSGKNHTYYPTQRTESCIASFVHRVMHAERGALVLERSQQHA